MNDEELKKAIDFHRSLVQKEIASEKIVDGKLIGPRTLTKKDHVNLKDIINPERPFLGKEVAGDLDSVYVTTFRIGNLKKPVYLSKTSYGTDVVAGIEMGTTLVKNGFIKNVDEIAVFLANYKMGILDIFKEEEIENGKKLDLRFYECIECAGLPNIGKPVCYFETGMIIGILKELTHKKVSAEEIRFLLSF